MTWTHDTGFGNTEAQYQVIPPQRHIAIGRTRGAGLFGVNGTAVREGGMQRKGLKNHFYRLFFKLTFFKSSC